MLIPSPAQGFCFSPFRFLVLLLMCSPQARLLSPLSLLSSASGLVSVIPAPHSLFTALVVTYCKSCFTFSTFPFSPLLVFVLLLSSSSLLPPSLFLLFLFSSSFFISYLESHCCPILFVKGKSPHFQYYQSQIKVDYILKCSFELL